MTVKNIYKKLISVSAKAKHPLQEFLKKRKILLGIYNVSLPL